MVGGDAWACPAPRALRWHGTLLWATHPIWGNFSSPARSKCMGGVQWPELLVEGGRRLKEERGGVGGGWGGGQMVNPHGREREELSLLLALAGSSGPRPTSQRSLHNAPIFRLALKVAVNGAHQCDFPNFCRQQCPTVSFCATRLVRARSWPPVMLSVCALRAQRRRSARRKKERERETEGARAKRRAKATRSLTPNQRLTTNHHRASLREGQ